MAYKTPGIYVEEVATLAPSVVAVETAVPAFIGYTKTAVDARGASLRFVATRIQSLLDYQALFGGEFVPARWRVVVDTGAANAVGAAASLDGAGNERIYRLAQSVRHFYANGGGPCWIVSVGGYGDAPALGTMAPPAGLQGGLSRVEAVDDPTLLLFPDGVALSAADLGSLQVAALAQCDKLQDRFVLMDTCNGDQTATPLADPIADFRQNVGTGNLKYGAAYYPWLRTLYRPAVHFRQLALVTPAAVPLTPAQIDALTGDSDVNGLVATVRAADVVVGQVVGAVNLGGMAGPNPLVLTRDNTPQLADHFTRLQELLRALPAAAPDASVREAFANLVLLPRAIVLALRTLETTAGLPAGITLAITQLTNDAALVAAITALVTLEKNADVMDTVLSGRATGDVENDYAALNGSPWILPNANVAAIGANAVDFSDPVTPTVKSTALNAASALRPLFDAPAAALLSLFSAASFTADGAETRLFAQHPVFAAIAEQVVRTAVLLPPSGAVAGVCAAVDRSRGVWKAPANVSLADVSGVAVKLNDRMQEDLNVTSSGKSVNAIRAFTGKGTLVWGARTLAGNDNEWRYVPVRRFFNMAEESIRKATEAFVFEPNDRGTWVRVRATIENFLTVQWRQGALAGSTPIQAYYVRVGLGETMTAQDILEGRLVVEIGMAVVRPAEFIVLRFAHKMQTS